MKHVLLAAIFCLTTTPVLLFAQTNAGFVKGLWYDQPHLIHDVPTRIYVAIRNNTGGDLTGTVEFYIDDKRIERNNVAALNNRIIESWADWTPRYGTTTISAVISRTELTSTASGTEAVEVIAATTEDVVFVDYDTDGDRIPNREDTDDDGDGYSDTEEQQNNTDPLDPNDPPPETDENEDSETDTTNETDNEPEEKRDREGSPEGLERFLANSPADETFTRITTIVNDSRDRLDTYRETRNERIAEDRSGETSTPLPDSTNEQSTTSDTSVTAGTGIQDKEIERVQNAAPKDANSWLSTIWKFITKNAQNFYTLILFLLSSILAHPALVQLFLLFLILYGIYKLARKFGRRDNT